jgi:hypothetical protein
VEYTVGVDDYRLTMSISCHPSVSINCPTLVNFEVPGTMPHRAAPSTFWLNFESKGPFCMRPLRCCDLRTFSYNFEPMTCDLMN